MPVIETQDLTRSFGAALAVDRLSLAVSHGEIFGLLGPNGAGKTTTIRMLTTLLAPTSGVAGVCGFDVTSAPSEVRRRIGYVMQQVAMSVGQLTGREVLEMEASLHHVPRRAVRSRATELLDLVELGPHGDKLLRQYSGGMRKRLDLACGLLHRPEVLILDEPSLGLDVQSRHRMWDHILGLRDEGVTILLATNYLDEADRLCDRITIIDCGREVVTGSPVDLKRAVGGDAIQVTTSSPALLEAELAGEPWVKNIATDDDGVVHVYVTDAPSALPLVARSGGGITRITYSQPTLDDVFLLHTGRELRELEESA